MGKNECQAYLQAIRQRYRQASRAAKTAILDEFCAVCGYHRKYAVRLLRQSLSTAQGPSSRPEAGLSLTGPADSAQASLVRHRSDVFQEAARRHPFLAARL